MMYSIAYGSCVARREVWSEHNLSLHSGTLQCWLKSNSAELANNKITLRVLHTDDITQLCHRLGDTLLEIVPVIMYT